MVHCEPRTFLSFPDLLAALVSARGPEGTPFSRLSDSEKRLGQMGRDLEIGTVDRRGEQGDRGQTRPELCPWGSFGLTAAKGRLLIQNSGGNKAKGACWEVTEQ